jgi:hypothetical protein
LIEPKILVLVLAINKEPWKRIETEGQLPTWRSSAPENDRILRYIGTEPKGFTWKLLNKLWILSQKINNLSRGRILIFSINSAVKRRSQFSPRFDLDNNEIITTVPDLYSLIGAKTLDAFDFSVQNFEFDYIYRTNVSSYLDLRRLRQFIGDKPKNNFYAGLRGNHRGIDFASGCGYFISRDLVLKVLRNKDLWDHNLIDDVAIGKLLIRDLNVDLHEIERIDLHSVDLDSRQIIENPLNVFHYRCKASNPDITIQIMKTLHKLV